MNQRNFEYLKDQIKFSGFGESLEKDLQEKMQKQEPAFQLQSAYTFGKDNVAATLHFRKSAQSELYFFNRFVLTLQAPQAEQTKQQTFHSGWENSYTLKEAYNLLSGRAVHKHLVNKENQPYTAWVQMDFRDTEASGNYKMKYYHDHYGYDLSLTLSKQPIKELAIEVDKNRLIESLKKGNRPMVTFLQGGTEQKRFIEANPRFKSLNIYDASMHRILQQPIIREFTEQQANQVQKQPEKQSPAFPEKAPKVKKKKIRKKKRGISP